MGVNMFVGKVREGRERGVQTDIQIDRQSERTDTAPLRCFQSAVRLVRYYVTRNEPLNEKKKKRLNR